MATNRCVKLSALFAITFVCLFAGGHVNAQTATEAATIKWRWLFGSGSPLFNGPVETCIVRCNVFNKDMSHLEIAPNLAPAPGNPLQGYWCYGKTRTNPPVVEFCDTIRSEYHCHNADGSVNINPNSTAVCTLAAGVATVNKQCGPNPACTGNPITPGSGNKQLVETDYVGSGPFALRLDRYYNSITARTGGMPGTGGSFGRHWRGFFDRSIYLDVTLNTYALAFRPDGKAFTFRPVSGVWVSDADVTGKLERLMSGGFPVGWQYTEPEGDLVETYDVDGRLTSMVNRAGLAFTLTYYSSGASAGLLETVTDSFGRSITFAYDSELRIATISNPSGAAQGTHAYGYDASGNLTIVTHPDGQVRTYHYNEPSLTSGANLPTALTGITDENGVRFASYGYDAQGKAISSEHAGGAGAVTVSYSAPNATVTDAFAQTRTYGFTITLGVPRSTSITGPVCPTCGPAATTYDANGFVTSRTDWNGNRTNYTHDARGLEVQRVEGLTSGGGTTPQTRTITTAWHPTYRLATQIAEPFRITTMVYGDPADPNPGNRGSLLSRTIQATTDANGSLGFSATPVGTPRTWTYTYNGNGQVLTMDGPRTDVSDVTAYTYYANDAACTGASAIGCRGQIQTITNAAGHVTQITDYNVHGQPLSITDLNGLLTTLTYDLRQRLTSRNVGGETTTYTYDNVGQLTRVTLPDGSFLNYTYDPAHRLTEIADNLGNRITYTLDAMGNRTREQVFDPASQLAQTRSRVYSNLNRLAQEIGAAGQTTSFGYDNQGNLTSIDGPLAGTVDLTTNQYDALNRLIRMTDPLAGQVNYGYNGLDQLTSVSDPRSLTTTYSYDGLNNLNQLQSPDTGATSNTYDAAGNLLTQTDAKGQTTTYTYDALNRVTNIVYQGGVTHTYQYDQGTNGVGRLTQITEPSSTTQYAYDQHGRVVSETRTINAVPYVTAYSYDSAGRMTGMTYPGGRTVTYTLDALGRVQQIDTTKDNTAQTVVSAVTYRPFGPTQGFTFGNGQIYSRGFDQDGRISSYTQGTQTIAVGYDPASRITSLADTGNPTNTNNYGYDTLDRLMSVTGPIANQAFTYDGVGNRLSKTVGASTDTYSYGATSNRLTQIAGANNRTYSYDNNGSTLGDSINQYTYDTRGRLAQGVSVVGTTNYQVNSLGQRIRKTSALGDTIYHYDTQGRLIAESSPGGTVQKEYIYLGDIPVAVIQ